MKFAFQDKMELALLAAVIDMSDKNERKRRKSKFDIHETSFTSLDRKIELENLRNCALLKRSTTVKLFEPRRRNGVCEKDENDRVLVTKALKLYNRLKHLDLNF